jgi:superfamily II DNA or RNA helicase
MTSPLKIRKYQKECVEACDALPVENGRIKIILPTGAGKTVISQEVIKNQAKGKDFSASLIFVPRLMLGKQWIKTTASYLKTAKLKFAFVNVNTGGVSNKVREAIEAAQFAISGVSRKLVSTVDPNDVVKEIAKLHQLGYHVIVISTYHSSGVIKESKVSFDLGLFDECHYLVSAAGNESEFRNALDVNIKRRLFLTATPRYTDSPEGLGMNNETEFGDVLFERKPKEIIEAGAIVGPKIHIVGCENIIDSKGIDHENRMQMIFRALGFHKEQVKSVSHIPNLIGAKLLVVCDGQEALKGLFQSKRFREIRSDYPKLRIYGLSSDFGLYIDGVMHSPPVSNSRKEDFLLSLDEMSANDDALIFHVDMIAEGLDVPGITGMLPLRQCSKIKFLQNLGRATRLHPVDAVKIYDTNALKVGDKANYIKPYCYVILPYCLDNREDFLDRYANIVDGLRSEYGFDPSDENVICDTIHAAPEEEKFAEDELNRKTRSKVIQDMKDFYSIQEEKCLRLDEILNVHKIRRFTAQQMSEFISLARNRDPR